MDPRAEESRRKRRGRRVMEVLRRVAPRLVPATWAIVSVLAASLISHPDDLPALLPRVLQHLPSMSFSAGLEVLRRLMLGLLAIIFATNSAILLHRVVRALRIVPQPASSALASVGRFAVGSASDVLRMAVAKPKHVAAAGSAALVATALVGLLDLGGRYVSVIDRESALRSLSLQRQVRNEDRAADLASVGAYLGRDREDRETLGVLRSLGARIERLESKAARTPLVLVERHGSSRQRVTTGSIAPEPSPLERLAAISIAFSSRSEDRRECVARFLATSRENHRWSLSLALSRLFSRQHTNLSEELVEHCGAIEGWESRRQALDEILRLDREIRRAHETDYSDEPHPTLGAIEVSHHNQEESRP
jgi:hypothetical protein